MHTLSPPHVPTPPVTPGGMHYDWSPLPSSQLYEEVTPPPRRQSSSLPSYSGDLRDSELEQDEDEEEQEEEQEEQEEQEEAEQEDPISSFSTPTPSHHSSILSY
ncbi:hypothetical protein V8E52_006591 [Russula decolorans]